ncbi:L,D-peptidoglycan transpeptidase YkuD (ErfK/YbiS/YcfS/YnhG family) [Streptacidiphilus sp. BW17]|jgi:L,D-peptidoglycan transpeptidase YkuD (ErfK/YbiS/YcfS/YnhG family)|uniref:L,D-transpeptidase family protein n=1 Tax=Streptacidiphilus sp. BW17 TaxID=3156274 RepID=UPI00351532FA
MQQSPHLDRQARLARKALGLALALGAVVGAGAPAMAAQSSAASSAQSGTQSGAHAVPARPDGIGPRTWSQVPGSARQIVLVQGAGWNSSHNTVSLWQFSNGSWQRVAQWSGHNGERGWTSDHYAGDMHTPTGVYTLHNAGGRLPNPGTRLSYQYSRGLYALGGHSANGASRSRLFDYVVAIDYNRVVGAPPTDQRRPMGYYRGGGIWFHVSDGNYTAGCVSNPENDMRLTERWLDPAAHPVIVMGPSSLDAQ